MSKSHEVRFSEAVAELRRQLDERNVEDAAAMAQDFVRWMNLEGWRPNARAIETSERLAPDSLATPAQVHAYADMARAAMAPNLTPKETP